MKDTHIQIRIRKELKRRFKKYCKDNNIDMSEFITDYIKYIVKNTRNVKNAIKGTFKPSG